MGEGEGMSVTDRDPSLSVQGCSKCRTRYIGYGVSISEYFYTVNGVRYGPYCEACVKAGIEIAANGKENEVRE